MALLMRCFILSFLVHSNVYPTTYIPVSIEKQLSESTMAIEGTWAGSESIKLQSGEIVTRHWFNVNKSSNPKIDEYLVNGELPVLVLGGEVDGVLVVLEGAPTFKRKDEVLLFVRKNQKGNWLQGLGIGKYDIKKIGSRKIYVSSIFPSHPIMGQIEDVHFSKLVKKIKGTSFSKYESKVELDNSNTHRKELESTLFVNKNANDGDKVLQQKRLGRKIASIGEEEEEDNKTEGFGVFWLVILLAILGGATQIHGRKGHKP